MLTSHYLEDIEALCRRTIVINHGSIVYDGAIDAVNSRLANKKIIKIQTLDAVSPSEQWKIRSSENGTTVLEADKGQTNAVVSSLLNTYDIKDFSVEDVPLEESLGMLYTTGKGTDGSI